MKTASMNRWILTLAAAAVLTLPCQSAWAWDVDENNVEGALVNAEEDDGAGDDGAGAGGEGAGADGEETVSARRTSFAASDDEEDAKPSRPSKTSGSSRDSKDSDDADESPDEDDGAGSGKARPKGKASPSKDEDEGDDGHEAPSSDGDEDEGEEARRPKRPAPAVEEMEEDDASLYPANHPRRRQRLDDDDDDGDGWIGVGQTRAPRQEDDGGDGDSSDSRESERGGTIDESQDYEPWFGESFFNAQHIGLSAELALGGYFRQGSMGGLEGKFGLGLSVAWNMGRLFFDRGTFLNKGLWLELSWLHPFSASGEEGTDMVKVTQSQHDLALAAMVGYPIWRLLVYGKVGPSMYVGSLDYDVGGSTASWSMVRGGLVYGVGVHSMFFVCDPVAVSARVELLGHRRSYYNDLQLTLKLGVAF